MNDVAPTERQRRRTTLSDVAERAGVSAVTVSRFLRKPEMVSEDLRARVAEAIRDLSYVPNQLASALASARTHRIGVVVPSFTNGVFGEYLRALHDVFLPAGFQVLVLNSSYQPEAEEKAIATMLGQNPEAIIITGVDQTENTRRMLAAAAIPVIQTMETADDPIDMAIGLSQRNAGYAATRHLIDHGHRNIAQMAVPLDARAHRRRGGYRQAMQEAGLAIDEISFDGPSSFKEGAELFSELLARSPDMTAVFCGNDNLALGAMFEAHRRGIRVPEDMSIIGFNNLEFAAISHPALTTVATPRYAIGQRSAEIMLEITRGSGRRPRERAIDLGFSLIVRESTGPRPPARARSAQPAAERG